MTWQYLTEIDENKNIPTEWVWERLRAERDHRLNVTDFRMVSDAPWDINPWMEYRQTLRDLPKTTSDPRLAEWPVAPND